MISTDIETKLRIGIFTRVAGHILLGATPREAAELTREWVEAEHLAKLDGECAAAFRTTTAAALDLSVAEYTDDTRGWGRMHPEGEAKVRYLRLACYAEVGKKLFTGMAPPEIRSAMRRTAGGILDALGPTSPKAHEQELVWAIATETIDRALYVYQTGDRQAE